MDVGWTRAPHRDRRLPAWRRFPVALHAKFTLLKHLARGAAAPEDMQERLLLDQATDFSYIIGSIALLGLSVVLLIFFDFFNTGDGALRNVAMLGAVACYVTILASSYSWLRRTAPTGRAARRYIKGMARLLFLLGAAWSVLLVILVRHAAPNQLDLLYAIMAGCLATPVMVSPAICALAYWFPISAGICAAVLPSHVADLFTSLDLMSFIVLTGFCILFLNRRLNERAIGAIRLEENAELIKLLLRDFEESASDWLWETDAGMMLQPVSRRLAQVARRAPTSFRGTFPEALLGEAAGQDAPPDSGLGRLHRAIRERSPFRDLVVQVIAGGEERYWSLTGKPILDQKGRFAGYHGVGSDITGQRRQQEQIAFLARHDSLTRLGNRVLFSEALHRACDLCEDEGIALLCVDLDNFKLVNDTLGHAAGDAVLVAVAERLRACTRDGDVAARLGGDEFALILATGAADEALAVAERIIERLSQPFHVDGQLTRIGASVGIALAPAHASTAGTLMKCADLALYRAKVEGRNAARFYDPAMDESQQERRALLAALRQAVAQGELTLEYQPVVDLKDRRIRAAEALLRWNHPTRGRLPPSIFIPIAEEAGLIGEIGEWVLRQACAAAARWPAEVTVAVNLSALQFRDPGLVAMIGEALRDAGLAPERLELEIVETAMLDTVTQPELALRELHRQGVRIALDDFGTGYSALSYLRRFPFDKIKIDRSFILDLGGEAGDSTIILAIIGLAERMNMVVTAEGVETPEQLELLTGFGCHEAQGFLFHPPVPAEEFLRLLRAPQLAV